MYDFIPNRLLNVLNAEFAIIKWVTLHYFIKPAAPCISFCKKCVSQVCLAYHLAVSSLQARQQISTSAFFWSLSVDVFDLADPDTSTINSGVTLGMFYASR